MLNTDKTPEIEEAVWRAWVRKNEARDKIRFARRMKLIGVVAVALAITALLERFTG